VLVGGYASRAELAEEYLVTNDRHPVSREQAQSLADRLWLERVAEQATWQGETDPERLTRAFSALQDAGITARENFACCRNCGHPEIGGEGGPDARGAVSTARPRQLKPLGTRWWPRSKLSVSTPSGTTTLAEPSPSRPRTGAAA
jgi:hypothetical protein